MNQQDDALVGKLLPYREQPGIQAALLISRDGFLVASAADPAINGETLAAHLGAVVDIGATLSEELDQRETKYISFELSDLNIVLAPFSDELLLALVGTPSAIDLQYRLGGGRA